MRDQGAMDPVTDGVVTLRAPMPGDREVLIAGRDDEFHRFLGAGSDDPHPTACIVMDDRVVGWVDHDDERSWLGPGEVNLGYHLFAPERGRGLASRAVALLVSHLAVADLARTATVLIDPANHRSLALADRLGFLDHGTVDGSRFLKRHVPPTSYDDGVVRLRRRSVEDLEIDLEAKDEEQIRWSWLPGEREQWSAMSPLERRVHAEANLLADHDRFGRGPKWHFSVDAGDGRQDRAVGYVGFDLRNPHLPAGDANVFYACHPAHRRRGITTRSIALVARAISDHTSTRAAQIIVDRENTASMAVARASGATIVGSFRDAVGAYMIRHALPLPPRTS